jgi:hypothetical protein
MNKECLKYGAILEHLLNIAKNAYIEGNAIQGTNFDKTLVFHDIMMSGDDAVHSLENFIVQVEKGLDNCITHTKVNDIKLQLNAIDSAKVAEKIKLITDIGNKLRKL